MEKERQYIIQHLRKLLKGKVEFALVFGSIITKNFNPLSDIDIAVLLNPQYNDKEKKKVFKRDIINSSERDIDLVILNDADIIITMQCLANGEIIINENDSGFILFKAQKVSEYIDFKMSRKIIEDNMLNGRLYA